MGKYYAVKVGKVPGIYNTWDECKENVDGYSGAVYKSFKTLEEAENFIGIGNSDLDESFIHEPYAFVDGSFNLSTKTYGFGGFIVDNSVKYPLSGSGQDEEMATMRNVAGEISGSMAAIAKALELGLDELTIYYDYKGIEAWVNGSYKANKPGTIAYRDYVREAMNKIDIKFVKVAAHTGIPGNEEADRMAKKAVGIE